MDTKTKTRTKELCEAYSSVLENLDSLIEYLSNQPHGDVGDRVSSSKSFISQELKRVHLTCQDIDNDLGKRARPYTSLEQRVKRTDVEGSNSLDLLVWDAIARDVPNAVPQSASEATGGANNHRQQFQLLHSIIEALNQKNVQPALNWITIQKKSLSSPSDYSDSVQVMEELDALAYDLHRLQFLRLLEPVASESLDTANISSFSHEASISSSPASFSSMGNGNVANGQSLVAFREALNYARTHLIAFPNRLADTQKLMLCLVFCTDAKRRGNQLLTASMFDDESWQKVKIDLIGCHARSMGLLAVSPLVTTLLASDLVLPTRLQVANLLREKQASADTKMKDTEPEEDDGVLGMDLGPAFQFHSSLVCPIRKDQTTLDNPPLLLKCGHVISQDAMLQILTAVRTDRFKCPTCPTMQASEDTLVLRL
eukprot:g54807.t1